MGGREIDLNFSPRSVWPFPAWATVLSHFYMGHIFCLFESLLAMLSIQFPCCRCVYCSEPVWANLSLRVFDCLVVVNPGRLHWPTMAREIQI